MSETDMTEYAELLRHLRLLARGKHDDVSIAADAAGAIIALLAERDALVKDAARAKAKLTICRELGRGFTGIRGGCDVEKVEAAEAIITELEDAAIDAAMAKREGEA